MAMYLDIPNIPGESASPNPNWNLKIEVQSAGYDLSQNASAQAGSGMIASQVSFSPMHITKAMDRSTPHLFGKLAAGEPIATVTLRVSRPGGSKTGVAGAQGQGGLFEAETYTMSNVIVTSYHTTGTPGPGGLPMESWTFAFTAINEKFQTVDVTGKLNPPASAGYDIAGGAALPPSN
ncbi:MAG: type VI secretion system tube protein Hcp [Bryobacteraceae bacterium]|jgi:type VI secretion system Hcp family effector